MAIRIPVLSKKINRRNFLRAAAAPAIAAVPASQVLASENPVNWKAVAEFVNNLEAIGCVLIPHHAGHQGLHIRFEPSIEVAETYRAELDRLHASGADVFNVCDYLEYR